ncbi:ArsR/SmtB family transcription factor [Alicyclobacillus kakegawensis]|uniref:ArsR/SmtB family transcription factor n=1 Tax=Alicyclobacillus kakegawensis TaxID=392012 RepID=UPI00082E5093|nr:metalloregulator ArsR/SmtB family transcription factor [Alicyclobacillus kakegawensis]
MMRTAVRHDVFQAIADPNRRQVIRLLAEADELSIASISDRLPISRTAVNKHLRVLGEAGLVKSRRVGRETRYHLQPQPLLEVKRWLADYERFWDEKLAALKRYVEAEEADDAHPSDLG